MAGCLRPRLQLIYNSKIQSRIEIEMDLWYNIVWKGGERHIEVCEICLHSPHLWGCPIRPQKRIGTCAECGVYIFQDEEIWTDGDGRRFCSEKCAEQYHEIREITEESE